MYLLCFIIIIWRNNFSFSQNQATKRTFSEDVSSGERFEMDICLLEIYWGMILGTIHVKKKGDPGSIAQLSISLQNKGSLVRFLVRAQA